MKKILLRSVYDAFDYVMAHYYPAGLEEFAEKRDSYVVISIQDTHTKGFGFVFKENLFCKGVLTLFFDDIEKEVDGAVLFSKEQADRIISFIEAHRDADTLLVHCYGGESRSRAVAAFAAKMLGGDEKDFLDKGHANRWVYETLIEEKKNISN